MRPMLFALPLVALAACVELTPQQQCIRQVPGGSSLNEINSLIRSTQGNIDRGYAVANVTDVVTRQTRCTGRNEDGSRFRFPCEETDTVRRQEPVAIDIAEERRKLASLVERQGQLQTAYDAGAAQCRATYPQ